MGMYGHSFGGSAAAAVLAADSRFVAGIDVDGFVIGPVSKQGVDKPFLVVGVASHDKKLDPSWKTFLPALAGGNAWHRWSGVKNSGHYRFIDLGGSVTKWACQAPSGSRTRPPGDRSSVTSTMRRANGSAEIW